MIVTKQKKENSQLNDLKTIKDPQTQEKYTIRLLDLKIDYERLVELYELVFQKELSNMGINVTSFLEQYRSLQRYMKIINIFTKRLKHALDGFVVENKSGNIIASTTCSESGSYWEISMVATHPNYRGKGIAKKLIKHVLEHIRLHNGKRVTLEVISDNTPAYNLYLKMGFKHFDSHSKLKLEVSENNLEKEDNFGINDKIDFKPFKSNKKNNLKRYDFVKAIIPDNATEYMPINKSDYLKPLGLRILRPVLKKLIKIEFDQWGIYKDYKQIGMLFVNYGNREGSIHEIEYNIDPEIIKEEVKIIVNFVLNHISNKNLEKKPILSMIHAYQPHLEEILKNRKFVEIEQNHNMGLILEI